jgi:hypothetical protein
LFSSAQDLRAWIGKYPFDHIMGRSLIEVEELDVRLRMALLGGQIAELSEDCVHADVAVFLFAMQFGEWVGNQHRWLVFRYQLARPAIAGVGMMAIASFQPFDFS